MDTKKVAKADNEQITHEFYSAYLYLDFCQLLRIQGDWTALRTGTGSRPRRRQHTPCCLLPVICTNNGEKVTLGTIQQPDKVLDSLMDPLKAGLEHEKLVTASINAIYTQAFEARDYRTMQVLDWFVKEQGEEEKNAGDMITKMELFGGECEGTVHAQQRAQIQGVHRALSDPVTPYMLRTSRKILPGTFLYRISLYCSALWAASPAPEGFALAATRRASLSIWVLNLGGVQVLVPSTCLYRPSHPRRFGSMSVAAVWRSLWEEYRALSSPAWERCFFTRAWSWSG